MSQVIMHTLDGQIRDFWEFSKQPAPADPILGPFNHFDVVEALWPPGVPGCLKEIRSTCMLAFAEQADRASLDILIDLLGGHAPRWLEGMADLRARATTP